jgi:hypothetical protein
MRHNVKKTEYKMVNGSALNFNRKTYHIKQKTGNADNKNTGPLSKSFFVNCAFVSSTQGCHLGLTTVHLQKHKSQSKCSGFE